MIRSYPLPVSVSVNWGAQTVIDPVSLSVLFGSGSGGMNPAKHSLVLYGEPPSGWRCMFGSVCVCVYA